MTPTEQAALRQARRVWLQKTEVVPARGFDAGFVAGLRYNQAKIGKLVSFIKGEIPRSEIEEFLQ
jgi:hypothetical protein